MILNEVAEAVSREFIKGLIFAEMYPGLATQTLDKRAMQKMEEYTAIRRDVERFAKDILAKMGG